MAGTRGSRAAMLLGMVMVVGGACVPEGTSEPPPTSVDPPTSSTTSAAPPTTVPVVTLATGVFTPWFSEIDPRHPELCVDAAGPIDVAIEGNNRTALVSIATEPPTVRYVAAGGGVASLDLDPGCHVVTIRYNTAVLPLPPDPRTLFTWTITTTSSFGVSVIW